MASPSLEDGSECSSYPDLVDSDSSDESPDTAPTPQPRARAVPAPGSLARAIGRAGVVPAALVLIILHIAAFGRPARIDGVELFAGVHSIVNGCDGLGLSAIGMDSLTASGADDITQTSGFLRALYYVIALAPDGLLWCAPPCSTWVWCSRSATKRSRLNPLGTERGKTAEANLVVSRLVLLVLAALLLHNVRVWMEQPASSILAQHMRWQQLLDTVGQQAPHTVGPRLRSVFLWLKAFGSEAMKPICVETNAEHA